MKKRILIDVDSVVPYYVDGIVKGIGRTTRELVEALDSLVNLPFEIMLYSQNMKGVGARDLETHFRTKHLYLPYRESFNKYVAQYHLRELLTHYDLMHIPHNYEQVACPERCVVTIHDAMFFTHPEESFRPEFCKKYYTELAQKAKGIITCSESSKRDIVKYMNVPENKVFMVYWGYDADLFHPRKKSDMPYPFFLSTSCSLGRKNTISVIRSFAQYRMEGGNHHLILVWRETPQDILNEIQTLGVSDYIHFARNIGDEELAQLYSDARATFFPSLYEGFGLPVLESLASGTPVVTCNNSSLPEVGGDAALYVDSFDTKAMTLLMHDLEVMKPERYDELKQQGICQAQKFSWRLCAQQTIEVYKTLLGY